MVEGIVKQSGGHVEVSSELGAGTCFRIYLPMLTEGSTGSREVAAATALPGRETILVVEDQAEVRQYAVAVLRAYGTGYSDDAMVRHGVPGDGVHFIQKPFSPADLTGKVREVPASSGRRR